MEWIKIKHVHVPANMTDAELGKLVKFQLEIARLERAMTESEKCAFFGRKEAQKSWRNVTKKHQICEDFVTKKVLEDCNSVTKLRQRNKGNKANSRSNDETVTGDKSDVVTAQIREDNIREDILINKKNINKKKIEIIKKNYHDFVTLSDFEYSKLIEKFGQTKTDWCIQIIGNYKGAKGAKYKSDYMAILGWPSEKYDEKRMKFETAGLSQKSIIALSAGNEFIQNQEEFGDVEGVEWAQ